MAKKKIRTYYSLVRQRQADETRTRIAEAARKLILGQGYGAATMEAIAREAGVATPTVYAVFGSKRNILAELMPKDRRSSYCAKPGSSFRSWPPSNRKRNAAGTRPKALPSPFSSNPPGSPLGSAKKKRGTFFGPSPRAISTECWLSNDNGVPTATRTGWAMLSSPFWSRRSLPGKSDEITEGRWAKPLTAMNARC